MKFARIIILLLPQISGVYMDCGTTEASTQALLSRLAPLKGRTFEADYTEPLSNDLYHYQFSICKELKDGYLQPGVIHKNLNIVNAEYITVGRTNDTSIKAGTDWIMLTYKSGDYYRHHCNKEARQAHVVISCNPNVEADNFAVLYEENSKSDCFYLMEMESKYACSKLSTGLSSGSIFLILTFSLLITYIALGMIYKRCVQGAKGIEQVPNIGFWRSCGNLQADGCDFLCRCQESGFDSSRPYRGIADEQLDDENDDENLLPM